MFNLKTVFIVCCLVVAVIAASNTTGGVNKLKGAERQKAVQLLRKSLRKLATGGGPSYTVSKVFWVTGQVVSGNLYKYKVGLTKNKVTKICNVSIWSQPWLENGNEITIKCPGEKVVKDTQSP